MIRQEQVKQPCRFRLLPQLLDQRGRCPFVLLELGFDDGVGGDTFIFDPVVDFLDNFHGFGGEFGAVAGGDAVE